MQRLSFIHISDLHLDNFSSVKKEENSLAVRLHESPYEALQNLLILCEKCKPQFIVFTGDLYQHGILSLKARLYLTKFFNSLAEQNIPFYYVKGNHDHIGQNDTFFEQFPLVFVYKDTWSSFTFPPHVQEGEKYIKLYGYSHNTRKENKNIVHDLALLPSFIRKNILNSFNQEELTLQNSSIIQEAIEQENKILFSIGLLHATVKQKGVDSEKVKNTDKHIMSLCSDEDLKKFPIDYWALGHIHEHSILSQKPYICYAGAMQATRMGETGEKGAILVTVENLDEKEKQEIHTQFYALSPLESYDIVLKLSEEESFMDLNEVQDFLTQSFQTAIAGISKNPYCVDLVIRLIIDGQHPLYEKISSEEFLSDFCEQLSNTTAQPRIFVKKIVSWLRPCFDFALAYKREDILGEVFRVLEQLRQDPVLFESILASLESEFKIKKEYELGFFQNSEMRSENQIKRYQQSLLRACENKIVNILEPK